MFPPREDQTRSMFRVVVVGAAHVCVRSRWSRRDGSDPAPSTQIAYIGKIPTFTGLRSTSSTLMEATVS